MTPQEINTTLAELRQRMESGRFFAVAYNTTPGTEEDEMKVVCRSRCFDLIEAAAKLMRMQIIESDSTPLFVALKTLDTFYHITR